MFISSLGTSVLILSAPYNCDTMMSVNVLKIEDDDDDDEDDDFNLEADNNVDDGHE